MRLIWCAVQTHGGQEERANRELLRARFATFFPLERVRRRRRVRNRGVVTEWIEAPYYPRYLFAKIEAGDVSRANDAPGVARVLSVGGDPIAIPESAMGVLMAGANAKGLMGSRDEIARQRFAVASEVTFEPGSPMQGFIARVLRDNGQRDVQVLVSMFGRVTQITAPATALRSVA